MSAPTYISAADITDQSLTETSLSDLLTAKLLKSDAAVIDMAKRKGVYSTDISTSPVHEILKQWTVAWVCRELCFDLIGKNPTSQVDANIYYQLYDLYKKRHSELDTQIDYEVLTGLDYTARTRPGPRTGTIDFS
jgi:hypothetical protein